MLRCASELRLSSQRHPGEQFCGENLRPTRSKKPPYTVCLVDSSAERNDVCMSLFIKLEVKVQIPWPELTDTTTNTLSGYFMQSDHMTSVTFLHEEV